MTDENKELRKIQATRRLKMVVPCVAVMLLVAILIFVSQGEHYGWSTAISLRMWLSLMIGPLACWIEFSGGFSGEDNAFFTISALVLALGILAHALWPNKITAVITILVSFLWFFWGTAITFVGV